MCCWEPFNTCYNDHSTKFYEKIVHGSLAINVARVSKGQARSTIRSRVDSANKIRQDSLNGLEDSLYCKSD